MLKKHRNEAIRVIERSKNGIKMTKKHQKTMILAKMRGLKKHEFWYAV